jgi:hypothetical protein
MITQPCPDALLCSPFRRLAMPPPQSHMAALMNRTEAGKWTPGDVSDRNHLVFSDPWHEARPLTPPAAGPRQPPYYGERRPALVPRPSMEPLDASALEGAEWEGARSTCTVFLDTKNLLRPTHRENGETTTPQTETPPQQPTSTTPTPSSSLEFPKRQPTAPTGSARAAPQPSTPASPTAIPPRSQTASSTTAPSSSSSRKRKHGTFLLDEEMHRCRGRAVRGDTPHLSQVFAFESGLDGGGGGGGDADVAAMERMDWNWGMDIPRSVGLWGRWLR